jgi:DNA-binding CsgD family transcriptional regulator
MLPYWISLAAIVLTGLLLYSYFRKPKARLLFDEAVFQKNCASYGLSAREVQVLRLVLEGKTYVQASDLLYISKKTVDSHVQHIYSKVGVRNKLQLMQKLYR